MPIRLLRLAKSNKPAPCQCYFISTPKLLSSRGSSLMGKSYSGIFVCKLETEFQFSFLFFNANCLYAPPPHYFSFSITSWYAQHPLPCVCTHHFQQVSWLSCLFYQICFEHFSSLYITAHFELRNCYDKLLGMLSLLHDGWHIKPKLFRDFHPNLNLSIWQKEKHWVRNIDCF